MWDGPVAVSLRVCASRCAGAITRRCTPATASSFFDVRGTVERPLRIDVEHSALDGTTHITTFTRAAARLWVHEIDHLHGTLYTDRMPADVEPVPVERYDGTAASWRYDPPGR